MAPVSPSPISFATDILHSTLAFARLSLPTSGTTLLEAQYPIPCVLPTPPVQLSGSHSALVGKLQHTLKKITMIALAAGSCSRDTMAPTSATLGHVLQNIGSGHGKWQGPRLNGSRHQPQTHTLLFSVMQKWIVGILTPVSKSL